MLLLYFNILFFQREELHMRYLKESSASVKCVKVKEQIFLKSNILFLCAAVVACSTFFYDKNELESVVEILAEKSLSSRTDIMTMANILFEIATRN